IDQNSTGTLTSPLNPIVRSQVSQQITYGAGIQPRPIESIANIAWVIYYWWVDTTNLRITKRTECLVPPFANFKWIIDPKVTPGAQLTPLKLGIVACWIMRGVLEQQQWPGEIKATIFNANQRSRYALEIGTLSITNMGYRSLASAGADTLLPASISPNDEKFTPNPEDIRPGNETSAADSPVSVNPTLVERRWLQCFSVMYWAIMLKSSSDIVTQDPMFNLPRGQELVHHSFPCGGGNTGIRPLNLNDKADIILFPGASATMLDWEYVARGMVVWINEVAIGRRDSRNPFTIPREGVELARVQVRLNDHAAREDA
ncbi:MAG: hypothetical protein Q9224_006346, partial [Gallowayella concinna]